MTGDRGGHDALAWDDAFETEPVMAEQDNGSTDVDPAIFQGSADIVRATAASAVATQRLTWIR